MEKKNITWEKFRDVCPTWGRIINHNGVWAWLKKKAEKSTYKYIIDDNSSGKIGKYIYSAEGIEIKLNVKALKFTARVSGLLSPAQSETVSRYKYYPVNKKYVDQNYFERKRLKMKISNLVVEVETLKSKVEELENRLTDYIEDEKYNYDSRD